MHGIIRIDFPQIFSFIANAFLCTLPSQGGVISVEEEISTPKNQSDEIYGDSQSQEPGKTFSFLLLIVKKMQLIQWQRKRNKNDFDLMKSTLNHCTLEGIHLKLHQVL